MPEIGKTETLRLQCLQFATQLYPKSGHEYIMQIAALLEDYVRYGSKQDDN